MANPRAFLPIFLSVSQNPAPVAVPAAPSPVGSAAVVAGPAGTTAELAAEVAAATFLMGTISMNALLGVILIVPVFSNSIQRLRPLVLALAGTSLPKWYVTFAWNTRLFAAEPGISSVSGIVRSIPGIMRRHDPTKLFVLFGMHSKLRFPELMYESYIVPWRNSWNEVSLRPLTRHMR